MPQVTQLNWRLAEGSGECLYCVGVEDNGHPKGLEAADLQGSLAVLRAMAAEVGAATEVLQVRQAAVLAAAHMIKARVDLDDFGLRCSFPCRLLCPPTPHTHTPQQHPPT